MHAAGAVMSNPGRGFGDFVLVALVLALLVGMIRDLRAHPEDPDEAGSTTAGRRNRSGASAVATETPTPSTRRGRARQRGRAAFRRFRKHSWLRKKLLPGEHGDPTPAATLADGVAGAFAVFAYAAGFAAGLAHAKANPAPPVDPASSTGKKAPNPGTASGKTGRRKPGRKGSRLTGLFRRQPPEGEVVDPEPIPAIGTARDADVIDAEILDDADVTPEPVPDPEPEPDTNTVPHREDPTMAIDTIYDLFRWTDAAVTDAEMQIIDAEMRAKVAAGRAADAAAVANSARQKAATLHALHDYWATQNMDGASLGAILDAAADADRVYAAEQWRAECEAATAEANVKVVAADRAMQESLQTMALTVKARQQQHAEAQAATGNAAASAVVLEAG